MRLHFVQLNGFPSYSDLPYFEGSLQFLEDDLRNNVGQSGRPIVIFHHENPSSLKYFDVIKLYNVIGIFHGHLHEANHDTWKGINYFGVPRAGEFSGQGGFTVVHITDKKMLVANRLDGSWDTNYCWERTIELPDPRVVPLIDSFDRPDTHGIGSGALGSTSEPPHYVLGETDHNGEPIWSSAAIYNNQIYWHTHYASGELVYLEGSDYANAEMAAEIKFDFTKTGTHAVDSYSFWLRRPDETAALGAGMAGAVKAAISPSGGVIVSEYLSDGTRIDIYKGNPLACRHGTGNNDTGKFFAGELPAVYNGLPFDVDQDGALESDEPFDWGIRLIGSVLEILINGLQVDMSAQAGYQSINLSYSDGTKSPTGKNTVALARGDAAIGEIVDAYFDNLRLQVPSIE